MLLWGLSISQEDLDKKSGGGRPTSTEHLEEEEEHVVHL